METHSFISLDELTRKLVMILIVQSGLHITSFSAVYLRLEFPLFDESHNFLYIVPPVDAVISAATFILFLIWFYRAQSNLYAFGTNGLKFTPKCIVIQCLIPIVNLWKPYSSMNEVWSKSVHNNVNSNQFRIVKLWWAFFLFSFITLFVFLPVFSVLLLALNGTMVTFFKTIELAGMVFVATIAASNICLIKILKEINFRQQSRSGSLPSE